MSIVDTDATLEEADALTQSVVVSLRERGISLPTPQAHDYLENGPRYATGPNVLNAADNINDCFPCGMEISIGRNVFDAGEPGFDLFCPNCQHQFGTDAIDWAASVGQWFDSGDVDKQGCPECSWSMAFMIWSRPQFGFGNLAFCFSNWFLKEEFVDHISELLERRVTWVKAEY